ncbi:hypothetical protein [Kordiimonas sp.]|uniref:hypothetical protein n=1 Tax=Kordiimonas sp. TaxID=1970157 RepID=UPI003B51ED9E
MKKTFNRTFNHFVKLRVGTCPMKWNAYLSETMGEPHEVTAYRPGGRWGSYAGTYGFFRSDDAVAFIDAAKAVLEEEWNKYR